MDYLTQQILDIINKCRINGASGSKKKDRNHKLNNLSVRNYIYLK